MRSSQTRTFPRVSQERRTISNWSDEYLNGVFDQVGHNRDKFVTRLKREYERSLSTDGLPNTLVQREEMSSSEQFRRLLRKSKYRQIWSERNTADPIITKLKTYTRPNHMTYGKITELINLHNDVRSNVTPQADEMFEISWSAKLEALAWQRAEMCEFRVFTENNFWDSFDVGAKGENLYVTWDVDDFKEFSPKKAIKAWYSRKKYFNRNLQVCVNGPCEPYVRLVWSNTFKIGCAWKKCTDINIYGRDVDQAILLVCYYFPSEIGPPFQPYFAESSCSFCQGSDVCMNNLCSQPKGEKEARQLIEKSVSTSKSSETSTYFVINVVSTTCTLALMVIVLILVLSDRQSEDFISQSRSPMRALDHQQRGGASKSSTQNNIWNAVRITRHAWLLIVISWMCLISVVGILTCYGHFIVPISDEFETSQGRSVCIGSLAFGFMIATNPLADVLCKNVGELIGLMTGLFGAVVSLIIASFSFNIYLYFIMHSLMFGFFVNLVCNNAASLIYANLSPRHPVLASGLTSTGISVGFLIMNPVVISLHRSWGWRAVMRILSAVVGTVGGLFVVTICLLKKTNQSLNQKFLVEEKMKKNVYGKMKKKSPIYKMLSFYVWCFTTFVWSFGFLFPYIICAEVVRAFTNMDGVFVFVVYGCSDLTSRILCLQISKDVRINLLYIYVTNSMLTATVYFTMINSSQLRDFYLYSVVCGFNNGMMDSFLYISTIQLHGVEHGQNAWRYVNFMHLLGMVIGTMINGILLDSYTTFIPIMYTCGSAYVFSALAFVLLLFLAEESGYIGRKKPSLNLPSSI